MKFDRFIILSLSIIALYNVYVLANQSTCHPQCSWKCDDPHCPAICDPVCEPPKCHTSCAEPKNAICDVKCEKPECEIKCPDKGCEMFDCPKCVTVCKQPHCVTHCQAPKPECEAVCEEPRCDWKCHKPACPKPKCELVCENPNCVPKVECCPCAMGAPRVAQPFPFFKEVESNKQCCGCGKLGATSDIPQVNVANPADFSGLPVSGMADNGSHLLKIDKSADVKLFDKPVVMGTGQYRNEHIPYTSEFNQRDRRELNLNLLHKDRS